MEGNGTINENIQAEEHLSECNDCRIYGDELSDTPTGLLTTAGEYLDTTDQHRMVFIKIINEGAFGKVLLMRDDDSEDEFAVKISRSNSDQDILREGKLLASIQNDGIVKCLGAFPISYENEDHLGLFFEYAQNGTFGQLLNRVKTPEERTVKNVEDAIQILVEVAKTLAFLHTRSQPIVHLDLKPDNILINSKGSPILADFGTARFRKTIPTYSGECTRVFAAPEQRADHDKVGPRSDIWALGKMLSLCFGVQQERCCENPKLRIWDLKDILSNTIEFQMLLEKCLSEEPEKRPTANEFAKVLEESLRISKNLITSKRASVFELGKKWLTHAVKALMVTGALVAIAGGFSFVFKNPKPVSENGPISKSSQVNALVSDSKLVPESDAVPISEWPLHISPGQHFVLTISSKTYQPEDTLIIDPGGSLQVRGTGVVKWPPSSGIRANGKLSIEGKSESQPIEFVPSDQQLGWKGIRINGTTANASLLKNLKLIRAFGEAVDYTVNDPDVRLIPYSKMFTSNYIQWKSRPEKRVRHFGGGLRIAGASNISLVGVHIESCKAERGGALFAFGVRHLTMKNCVFQNNISTGHWLCPGGAAMFQCVEDVRIIDSLFFRNQAKGEYSCGGGIYFGTHNRQIQLEECVFEENTAAYVGAGVYMINEHEQLATGSPKQSDMQFIPSKIRFVGGRFKNNYTEFWKTKRYHPSIIPPNHFNACPDLYINDGCIAELNGVLLENSFTSAPLLVARGTGERPVKTVLNNVTFHCIHKYPAAFPTIKTAPFHSQFTDEYFTNSSSTPEFDVHDKIRSIGIINNAISSMPIIKTLLPKECFKVTDASREIDTIVLHYASAINWSSSNDSSFSQQFRKDFLSRLDPDTIPKSQKDFDFDPRFIRAIFEAYGVGSHYLVDRDGKIYQLIEDNDIAFHAGKSQMPERFDPRKRTNVNEFSIGIEIIADERVATNSSLAEELKAGFDSPDGNRVAYTIPQYYAIRRLIGELKKKYDVKVIVGHDEIAPGRKTDPGTYFDWNAVRMSDGSPR